MNLTVNYKYHNRARDVRSEGENEAGVCVRIRDVQNHDVPSDGDPSGGRGHDGDRHGKFPLKGRQKR